MSKEKAIKHINTIKSYITCIHEDLSEGKKINPFGLAYKFAIQECDKALKELEEWYENLEAISICVTYDSYMYYRIRNWKFFVAFNHTSNMGNNRKYYITGESN